MNKTYIKRILNTTIIINIPAHSNVVGEFANDAFPLQRVDELDTGENPGKHFATRLFWPKVQDNPPNDPDPEEEPAMEVVFWGIHRPVASENSPAAAHAVMIPILESIS
jgi:hypothetical protein